MMYEAEKKEKNHAEPVSGGEETMTGAAKQSLFEGDKKQNAKTGMRKGDGNFAALILENLQQNIGVLLLGLVVMLFNFPVNLALSLSSLKERYALGGMTYNVSTFNAGDGSTSIFSAEKLTELQEAMTREVNSVLLGWHSLIAFIVVVAAAICAYAMFKHVFSKQQLDFYFSQPITRKKRFAANYLAGVIIMAICFVLGYVGAILVAAGYGVEHLAIWEGVCVSLGYMVMFLLYYTVIILCMLVCGNLAVTIEAVIIVAALTPAIAGIISALQNSYFPNYISDGSDVEWLFNLSPVYVLAMYMDSTSRLSRLAEMGGKALSYAAGAGLATLVVGMLSMVLYGKRPAESAGRTLSFRKTAMPFRILLTVVAGLLFSLIGIGGYNFAWGIFFMLAGVIIAHAILEIEINMDVRALLKHKAELLLCAVLAFSVIGVFKYDVFGINSYLPETEKVESASVYLEDFFDERRASTEAAYEYEWKDSEIYGSMQYWESYPKLKHDMKLTDAAVIDAIKEMAEAGLLWEKEKNSGETTYITSEQMVETTNAAVDGSEEIQEVHWFTVHFRLKNGKTVSRQYQVPREAVMEEMPLIFDSAEYKEAMFPILNLPEEKIGVFGIEYQEENLADRVLALSNQLVTDPKFLPLESTKQGGNGRWVFDVVDLSRDQALQKALLKALKEDLWAMQFTDYERWQKNMEDGSEILYKDLLYYVPVEEVASREEELAHAKEMNWNSYELQYHRRDVYPIFESFTHVREVLSEQHLL